MFTGFVIDEKSLQKDWIQNIFKINVEYERVSFFFLQLKWIPKVRDSFFLEGGNFINILIKLGIKKGLDMIHFKFQHDPTLILTKVIRPSIISRSMMNNNRKAILNLISVLSFSYNIWQFSVFLCLVISLACMVIVDSNSIPKRSTHFI